MHGRGRRTVTGQRDRRTGARAGAAPVQEARVLGKVAVLAAVLAQHVAQLAQRQHAVAVLVRVPEQVLGLGQRLTLRTAARIG